MSENSEETVVIDPQDPLTQRILDVCDRTGDFIEWWGFRAIHGRVWTLLAITGRPLSQMDISVLLDVSRSLVNGAVLELEEWGLVERVGDHRRAPIVAVTEVWPIITQVLRTREWMMIERVRLALEAAAQEADVHYLRTGQQPFSRERLHELMQLTEMAQSFLKVILNLRLADEGRGVRAFLRTATQVLSGFRRVTKQDSSS